MHPYQTPISRAEGTPERDTARVEWAAPRGHPLVYGLRRYWLAGVLAAMLVFTSLPFLAPVAMQAGWTDLGNLIYTLYSPFCHQLPQRSWFLFGEKLTYTLDEIAQVYPHLEAWQLRRFTGAPGMGWKVAWSDRMISFYFLTPVFGLVYAIARALGWRMRPLSTRLFVVLLLPIALDAGTHLVNDLVYGVAGNGFRDANAWLAWLTGGVLPGFYAGDQAGTFNWWMRLLTGLAAAWGLAFWLFPWLDRLLAAEAERYMSRVKPDPRPILTQESLDR